MAGKNRKTPFASIVPSQEKTPRTAAELPLYTDQKAAWRVSKIQLIEPYGWHELSPFEVAKIKDRLSSFEKNTWKEIFVDQARFHHRISADELKCSTARQWMKKNMPDQDYLWTLRVTGAERIWGILSQGAYQVLFWDPEHLIWEVPKN
jgi:hypothetical protein